MFNPLNGIQYLITHYEDPLHNARERKHKLSPYFGRDKSWIRRYVFSIGQISVPVLRGFYI